MTVMTGIEQIATERQRQLDKGYTAEKDGEFPGMCIAMMLAPYFEEIILRVPTEFTKDEEKKVAAAWRRAEKSAKTKTPRQCLVAIGALVAAELDRMGEVGHE